MDSILLQNINVWTRIGIPDEERRQKQQIFVTVELLGSLRSIAKSDNVSDGIDYAKVTEEVQEIAKIERKTIERFAEDIASMILQKFKPEGGVRVTVVKKPDLPLESASVTIVRP